MKQVTHEKSTFDRLDEELLELYQYLKKKNFQEGEISQIFEPLLSEKKKAIKKYILILISIFLLMNALVKTEIGWWYILSTSRMFLIRIKPIYEWSHLKNKECLIFKWWQEDITKNSIPNCNFCENIKEIEVLQRLDNDELGEFYIEVQKPVILDYEGLPSVYYVWTSLLQEDDFLSSFPCSLETNVMEEGSVRKILRKISLFRNFFVHFQNCAYENMKYLRKIVSMPDLASKHISPVQYNWLIWSKNYTFSEFKTIDLVDSENVKLICQVGGEAKYKLSPPEVCRQSCRDIEVTLRKKQILFFTNFWRLAYKISQHDAVIENVAFISEAHSIF
ncbi:uncharacterized protein LOC123677154 [Harmonia axyridis]|uniref:uncharacterized protein LOC123677154 n=1 Tax=Harmonia axyridis TaxID=115357 RepID=UPI001E276153|nr:uncharacterized protein LOC123677154 [Harmonia axyridis]XP_045469648.1 uncharacterized protein LOC123677154 [Harmonia axyridis]XP_045469649.1 uncharacterized protein LOC123677154 [Harmonia axyridis]